MNEKELTEKMYAERKRIAKTIIEQLRWGDNWRPARWAAREYVSIPEGDEGEGIGEVLGGLCFKVSGTNNVKRGGYVFVYLKPNDTYTVRVIKVNGSKITPVKIVENTYCDNFGEIIDNILDGSKGE